MKKQIAINRRDFLRQGLWTASIAALGCPFILDTVFADEQPAYIKPALHWKKLEGLSVQCQLCPNGCTLRDGDTGACRARKNIKGSLHTLVYGRLASMHVDPVEKKPLYHFMPGSRAYSVATAGCNLWCKFCQNWQLSQSSPDELRAVITAPRELVRNAAASQAPIIAYTYNEPTVQYEFIHDSSIEARRRGIKSVIISNGYINPGPGKELARKLDGVKIDLKAFSEDFYSKICGGSLKAVLTNIEAVYSTGTWLELVVLVIPTLNDSPKEIRDMARWVRKNLSPNVPMHFTRFHAMYLIRNLPSTPVSTLERCRSIAAEEGIRYAYVGNVTGHRWENTYCHNCGKELISRQGFFVSANKIKSGRCSACGTSIPGVWT